MKALLFVEDGFEDLTVFVPWYRLREEGVDVTLVAGTTRSVTGSRGYTVEPDLALRSINCEDYELLIIPSGRACERLRLRNEALDIARQFSERGCCTGVIGHGAQVLLSAGLLDGRTITCAAGIRDDVRSAGAFYRDESTILDGQLLSCRGTEDLPEFCRRLMAMLRSPSLALLS
jgi:protease I